MTDRDSATVEDALGIIRRDYQQDVDSIATDIVAAIKDGEITDSESLQEYLHSSVDGSGRVIYTQKAMLGLLVSDNDGAYADNFGAEGMVEDGQIQWSRLMYAALEQDVLEELDRRDVDVNDPCPEPEDEDEEAPAEHA